jgi:6-phosphogluconolactonase
MTSASSMDSRTAAMTVSRDDAPQHVRWHAPGSAAELAPAVTGRTLELAQQAIAARGRFTVVLAGGETPRAAYERLRHAEVGWRDWHIYFGDERCVPRDDPQRNSRMANEAWLAHVPIPRAQIHEIPAELGPVEAARRYAALVAGIAAFDLVLLGLGEDGHTASLFPGHDLDLAADTPDAVAVFAAPKPPPQRVSLSARRLSRAEHVFFLVAGADKTTAVKRWRDGQAIPAALIRPARGVDAFVVPAAGS